MATSEKDKVSLSGEELSAMIAAAVNAAVNSTTKASRELTELEQFELEEKKAARVAQVERRAQEREMQEQQARTMLIQKQNEEFAKDNCTHTRRMDGSSRAVFVEDVLGGYMLCQKCRIIVRRGQEPKNNDANHRYDTPLFNRLFQMSTASGVQD